FLGRPQPATFQFANASARPLAVHYTPAVPAGFETLARVRRVRIAARGTVRDPVTLLPVRLGPQRWPKLPARVLGPLRLAWWTRPLDPHSRIVVAPDALRSPVRPRGLAGGARPRRVGGAGAELHQLRAYAPGDPLARIDWKATARAGALITREFSEDQHLDILIGIDAGRFSRVRVGRLDRFGLYANLAARFAEVVTHPAARIGLTVYAGRVLASWPPARAPRRASGRTRGSRSPPPSTRPGPRPSASCCSGSAPRWWRRRRSSSSRRCSRATRRCAEGGACSAQARNPIVTCEPSQKGLFFDAPQRHSVMRLRTSYLKPSAAVTGTPPRTHTGPLTPSAGSSMSPIDTGNGGSTSLPVARSRAASRPDGQWPTC